MLVMVDKEATKHGPKSSGVGYWYDCENNKRKVKEARLDNLFYNRIGYFYGLKQVGNHLPRHNVLIIGET